MKLKQTAATVSLLAIGVSAMAVEATQWNPEAGGFSRQEVKAALARSIANGELKERGEAYAGFHAPSGSTLTRFEVKQEFMRARANGELDTRNEAYDGRATPHPRAAAAASASGNLQSEPMEKAAAETH